MGASVSTEVRELIDNRLEYQVSAIRSRLCGVILCSCFKEAVSSNQFSESSTGESLYCINCMRMGLGDMPCLTSICDMCGDMPSGLQWMYPGSSRQGQMIRVERRRRNRRPMRPTQQRSASSDRATPGTQASTSRRFQRY